TVRERLHVEEGHHLRLAQHHLGGDLAADDAAEDAVTHASSTVSPSATPPGDATLPYTPTFWFASRTMLRSTCGSFGRSSCGSVVITQRTTGISILTCARPIE